MNTKAIKQKMKSIGNIRKITKTMEMVSVAKMKKAVDRATRSRLYSTKTRQIIKLLGGHESLAQHSLVVPRISDKVDIYDRELLVIIAGDKGLCGSYHVQLAKTLREYIQKKSIASPYKADVIAIGRYGEKIANKLGLPIEVSFSGLPESLDIDKEVYAIRNFILKAYASTKYYKVMIASTEYHRSMFYTPSLDQLLPFATNLEHDPNEFVDTQRQKSEHTTEEDPTAYAFEPDTTTIFDFLAPSIISALLLQALFDSKASEHSSRMITMKNASDNAENLRGELQMSYNRVRQALITQEITEIISGVSALED